MSDQYIYVGGNGGGNGGGGTSTALTWAPLSVDGLQTVATVATLASAEICDVAVTVNMVSQYGGVNASAWWQRKFFGVQNTGGTLAGADGGTSDQAIDSLIGSSMTGASAKLAISGTSIVVQAQRPTGVACYVAVTVDYVRGVYPLIAGAPTLDARTIPLMAGAAGTSQPFTITGSNLTPGTTAKIGGVTATVTATTGSSISMVCPALTASATPYNIVVTNTAGSATLSSAIYVIPSSFVAVWYAGMNATPSSWTDIIGGLAATQGTAGRQPTVTSNWVNSQPAMTATVAGNTSMTVSSFTLAQPFSVMMLCDSTSYTSGSQYFCDNGVSGAGNTIAIQRLASTGNYYIMGGSQKSAGSYAWGSPPVSLLMTCDSANTDSNLYKNGTALRFAENDGTAAYNGITLFNSFAGSQAINGDIGFFAINNTNLGPFSSLTADATLMRNILIAIYGVG